MSVNLNNILNSIKKKQSGLSKSEPDIKEPLASIDLGNGYVLVHTHTNPPEVSDRGAGYSGVDFYEIRHPASEHVLAGLTGMTGEQVEPVVKIGVILPEHKALGVAKNVFEAMKQRYGSCPEDVLSFLRTAWGDEEESPSVEESEKVGKWSTKIEEVFGALKSGSSENSLEKAEVKLYHGTNADFEHFSNKIAGNKDGTMGPGTYFSDDPKATQAYGTHRLHERNLEDEHFFDLNQPLTEEQYVDIAGHASSLQRHPDKKMQEMGRGLERKLFDAKPFGNPDLHHVDLFASGEGGYAGTLGLQNYYASKGHVGVKANSYHGTQNKFSRYYNLFDADHVNELQKNLSPIDTVIRSLKKSQKQTMVKLVGKKGWHALLDIQDTKIPAHQPGGGNVYTIKHGKTGEKMQVHQSEVEDMAESSELTKVQYYRRYQNRTLAKKNPDKTSYDLGDGYSVEHSADSTVMKNPTNYWNLKHGDNTVGNVTVVHRGTGTPSVDWSDISREHRGKGLGRRAYQKLAEHYGSLSSDENRTPAATRAWRKIGGVFEKRPGQRSNRFGRYKIDTGKDPVQWAEAEKSDKISGGLADKKSPEDFDQKDLESGRKVEREHTSSPEIAEEIAMDHLSEDPKYYQKLSAIEKKVGQVLDLFKSDDEREQKILTLAGQTQVGVDPISGERALLMFRGMDKEEFESTVYPDEKVEASSESVWTPFPDLAMKFAPTGFLVGAWISEKNLVIQRNQPGKVYDEDLNRVSPYKVVVKPHSSSVLDSDNIAAIIKKMHPEAEEDAR